MTHSPAEITRQLLLDLSLGSGQTAEGEASGEWPVYDSNEPARPDETITVYDVGAGIDNGRYQYTGERAGPRGLQIRVRAKTKKEGYEKAASLFQEISRSPQEGGRCYRRVVTVDGASYFVHCYSRISNVIPLGKENPTSTRRIFVINCVVTITTCPQPL